MVGKTSNSVLRDNNVLSFTALVYSLSLGVQAVLLPLLALAAGYSKPDIGILTALSAVTQLVARMLSAAAMRHVSDKLLVAGACLAMAVSGFLVAWSAFVVVFVLAELIQGLARGVFWTAATTHVVRQTGPSVGRMAAVNFMSSCGLLAGPLLAGYIARFSLSTAFLIAGIIAILSAIPATTLVKELPFVKQGNRVRREIWNQREVRIGSWAGLTAGSWRGILNSYTPVVLKSVGESYFMVGLLVAIANAASIAGAGVMGLLNKRSPERVFAIGVLGAACGTALVGITARSVVLTVVLLAVGGVGAGLLQTLGPVLAANGVSLHQKGDAIAIAGSFRAGALLVAPFFTAMLLGTLGMSEALFLVGGVLGLPILAARGVFQRSSAT
ncbi:MAG: MFS transporter [Acidimicrobiaceae bacterium]|nr:MFS transporter [Acidimicrobiaceae bacterium]